jgi:hypothetical protein
MSQENPVARLRMAMIALVAMGAAVAHDAAAPEATSNPQVPPVAPMDCKAPRIPQRASVAPEDLQFLDRQTDIYAKCASQYIEEHKARMRQYSAMAQAEADAANNTIKEVNDFYAHVKVLKDRSKLTRPDQ